MKDVWLDCVALYVTCVVCKVSRYTNSWAPVRMYLSIIYCCEAGGDVVTMSLPTDYLYAWVSIATFSIHDSKSTTLLV